MENYIMLRDDDTNYFTSCEDLQRAYGEIWDTVPVTLATIPFAHGSERKILDYDTNPEKFNCLRDWEHSASVTELNDYYKVHPIGENDELVAMLKEKIKIGKAEIAQHGVFHKYTEKGAEMIGGKVTFEDVRDGHEYLGKVFNREIATFIPPSNSIDKPSAENVSRLGMNIVCSSTIKYSNKAHLYLSYLLDGYYSCEKLLRKIKSFKPPIHKRNGMFITCSHTFGVVGKYSDPDRMLELLKKELELYGFTALGTHYRLFQDPAYKKNYYSIVNQLMRLKNVKFLTADDYVKKIRKNFYG